jgi:hypothetical protein
MASVERRLVLVLQGLVGSCARRVKECAKKEARKSGRPNRNDDEIAGEVQEKLRQVGDVPTLDWATRVTRTPTVELEKRA